MKGTLKNTHLHVLQDDFRQQVFEVLVEIFRKKSQNCLSRGQITEGHQPSEVVQSLEQLQDREGSTAAEGWGQEGTRRGTGGYTWRGRGRALDTLPGDSHIYELTAVWGPP